MKTISAFGYLERLDSSRLSQEDRNTVRKYSARIEEIDAKLIALKGERRMLADWFVSTIAAQKAKNGENSENTIPNA